MELSPCEGRGVPGKVVRAGLPDGQNWNREHQGHWVAQGSCLFCDAMAGPAGKGSEKSELHHKTTRSLCKSTETLPCRSLCITQHVPAMLAHAGFVPLGLLLLQKVWSRALLDHRFLCAVLLVDSLVCRFPLSDPPGRTHQHHPHLAVVQLNSCHQH